MHSHHSHSGQFCKHAVGQLEDVVKAAIERGFVVYGLTEHVPRWREQDLYPEERDDSLGALLSTFKAFIVEARRLQSTYSDRIELLVGLETEYIVGDDLERLKNLIEEVGGVDYIVGSVHHAAEVPIDFDQPHFQRALDTVAASTGLVSSDVNAQHEHLCMLYLDSQYDLLTKLQPAVVGHFDLCRLYRPEFSLSDNSEVWSRVERNVAFAISYGALFEANAAAFRKGWRSGYPGPDVAKLILNHGGRFVLSDDSHGPHAVGLNYQRLREYLLELGLQDLWYLTKRSSGAKDKLVPIKVEGQWWEHPFWGLPPGSSI